MQIWEVGATLSSKRLHLTRPRNGNPNHSSSVLSCFSSLPVEKSRNNQHRTHSAEKAKQQHAAPSLPSLCSVKKSMKSLNRRKRRERRMFQLFIRSIIKCGRFIETTQPTISSYICVHQWFNFLMRVIGIMEYREQECPYSLVLQARNNSRKAEEKSSGWLLLQASISLTGNGIIESISAAGKSTEPSY